MSDPTGLAWMLERLRPTPFGQFTTAVRRRNPAAGRVVLLDEPLEGGTSWPHPGFDRGADAAERTAGWRLRQLHESHLPYITSPDELATTLLELAADPSGYRN